MSIERWDLCERQIFGEALRRDIFGGAVQYRQERSAGGMRAPDASVKVGRDLRAGQRMLEHAQVLLWRALKDGHFVETNAPDSFFENPPRDFNAFTAFTGCREPDKLTCRISLRGRIDTEQVTREPHQIRLAILFKGFECDPASLELRSRT